MNDAAEVLAVVAGVLIVLATLLSAVRTVVMPHGAGPAPDFTRGTLLRVAGSGSTR